MESTAKKPTLTELRRLIGAIENHETKVSQCSLYPAGFPSGAIINLSGCGKTTLVSQFLKENPNLKVAWLEESISINPYSLFQKGVNLKNIVFLEAKNELRWCLNQALNSGCFQVLVSFSKRWDEKDLRRYQLMCEKNESHLFLLSELPLKSWVPKLQLDIKKSGSSLVINAHKKRGYA